MTQWTSDDASNTDPSLLDELDSVSTAEFPRLGAGERTTVMPPTAGGAHDARSDAKRKHHHWWMIALTVVLSLLAVGLIGYGIVQAVTAANAPKTVDAGYVSTLQKVTEEREDLDEAVEQASEPAQTLAAALPSSAQVQDFTQTLADGSDLVKNPPEAFTTAPTTEARTEKALDELKDYSDRLTTVTSKLKNQMTNAGRADAEQLYTSTMTGMTTSIQQGQLILDSYTSQKERLSKKGTDGKVVLDTALVDDLTAKLDAAKAVPATMTEGAPVDIATAAVNLKGQVSDLKASYDALQKGINEALAKPLEKEIDESQLQSTDGQIPQALQGTWTVEGGGSMTFGADSLQNLFAKTTQIDPAGLGAPYGGTAVGAWSLTNDGRENGVEDTTVVLFTADDGSQFAVVKTAGNQWKLTR